MGIHIFSLFESTPTINKWAKTSNLPSGWSGSQTMLHIRETKEDFKLLVGGRWDTGTSDKAYLYQYGLQEGDEKAFFTVNPGFFTTYYSVCDFSADLDFDAISEIFIVGIRDEAPITNGQEIYSLTSFGFDIYEENSDEYSLYSIQKIDGNLASGLSSMVSCRLYQVGTVHCYILLQVITLDQLMT